VALRAPHFLIRCEAPRIRKFRKKKKGFVKSDHPHIYMGIVTHHYKKSNILKSWPSPQPFTGRGGQEVKFFLEEFQLPGYVKLIYIGQSPS